MDPPVDIRIGNCCRLDGKPGCGGFVTSSTNADADWMAFSELQGGWQIEEIENDELSFTSVLEAVNQDCDQVVVVEVPRRKATRADDSDDPVEISETPLGRT